MEINLKTLKALSIFMPYTKKKQVSYLIYGSHNALSLYSSGLQELISSGDTDFMITSLSNNMDPSPPIVINEFNIEALSIIDKPTYDSLYRHLSKTFRAMITKK